MFRFLKICTLVCAFVWPLPISAKLAPDLTPEEEEILEELEDGTASIDEVGRQLSNPVGTLWNLVVQNSLSLNNGDLSNKDRVQWVTNLQPVLPIPLTERWNLITRPVLPIVSAPIPTLSGFDRETGLGDMALLNLLSPADPRGLIWVRAPASCSPPPPTMTSAARNSRWGRPLSACFSTRSGLAGCSSSNGGRSPATTTAAGSAP